MDHQRSPSVDQLSLRGGSSRRLPRSTARRTATWRAGDAWGTLGPAGRPRVNPRPSILLAAWLRSPMLVSTRFSAIPACDLPVGVRRGAPFLAPLLQACPAGSGAGGMRFPGQPALTEAVTPTPGGWYTPHRRERLPQRYPNITPKLPRRALSSPSPSGLSRSKRGERSRRGRGGEVALAGACPA